MDYYLEENVTKTEEHVSGNYKLVIKTYNTSKLFGRSTWDYTEGFVYNNDKFVGSIKRNYGSFPFCFFGHYLISGRSYMKQTVIHCETGQIYDNTDDPESDEFCWSSIMQMDDLTLVVYGCYWGAGYEYKFFDVSNVEVGWPALKVDDVLIQKEYLDYHYMTEHTVKDNILTIIYFEDDEEEENPIVDIKLRLQRENDMIKMLDVTLSEKEKIIQEERDIKKAIELKRVTLLKNNSYYLNLMSEINNLGLKVRDSVSHDQFTIYVDRDKSKTCVIVFTPTSNINFNFYDWTEKTKNISLKFNQSIDNIEEMISKINELL